MNVTKDHTSNGCRVMSAGYYFFLAIADLEIRMTGPLLLSISGSSAIAPTDLV